MWRVRHSLAPDSLPPVSTCTDGTLCCSLVVQGAVEGIISRCNKEKLMEVYEIATFSTCDEFLGLVATKRCTLKGGGVPDKKRAARAVLQDWNQGKVCAV